MPPAQHGLFNTIDEYKFHSRHDSNTMRLTQILFSMYGMGHKKVPVSFKKNKNGIYSCNGNGTVGTRHSPFDGELNGCFSGYFNGHFSS